MKVEKLETEPSTIGGVWPGALGRLRHCKRSGGRSLPVGFRASSPAWGLGDIL